MQVRLISSHLARVSLTPPGPPAMIGGADENDAEEVRPSTRTTTSPSPPSPPPPIGPPSSPAQPTSLGRRLLGSIRAFASHHAPPPAAHATKVGLGLLLDLRSDHPRLYPTPSASPAPSAFASASASEEDGDGDAAAARPHAAAERDAGAGLHLSASNQCRPDDGAAPTNTMFRHSGASGEENLAGDTEKVGEQQRAVYRKGATFVKDVDATGPDDQQEKACTGDQLRAARDGDQERDAIHPRTGTTCCGIAAQDDQEKAVQQCDTRELGTAENDGDDAEDNGQEAVEQGLIDSAMDDDNAAKDHEVFGRSVIAGIEMHATIDVQDQHKGVEATVLFSKAVSATVNGSDRGIGKKEKVKLPYPQRPGKPNCPTYMSKGRCSAGYSCQFHRPQLKAKPDGSWCPSEQGNHGVADILELNRIGLPIREGARNCTYYVRGACRYGKRCHFKHPEHVTDAQFYAPTGWEDSTLGLDKSSDHHTTLDDTSHWKKSSDNATLDDTSYSKKSSDHATLDATSYSKNSYDHATIDDSSSSSEVLPSNMLRTLLPPQKVLPGTEGKVMQVKKDSHWSSNSDNSDGCCSADSSDGPLCKQEHVGSSDGPLCKQQQQYPERPGQPDCRYYLQFRKCKFLSTCIFHHPRDGLPVGWNPSGPAHSDQIRPVIHGMPECPFYMKSGKCQFGAACEFRHPKDICSTTEGTFGHKQEQTVYPERPGVPQCFYYMRYGSCRFQMNCRYHHPADRLSRKQYDSIYH